MNETSEACDQPTLVFFRNRPSNLLTSSFVASSLQAVESSFFLMALGRYPHALTVCASAIESALQAAPIGASEKDGLQTLVKLARKSSASISQWPIAPLDALRDIRNKFTHRGFSPKDDGTSVRLYLDVAMPFLCLCYREFHAFDLMDGLLREYANHIEVGQRVLARLEVTENRDVTYCVRAFCDTIRWCFKNSFSSEWEIDALVGAEERGAKFESVVSVRERLESQFGYDTWLFDCPVCDEHQGIVAEIDVSGGGSAIRLKRIACAACGFHVKAFEAHLADALFEKQLVVAQPNILREYGIT
jgi:hypothetical protein